jgi:dTDP-4-dehydrorhamnose 3,5-epimerase
MSIYKIDSEHFDGSVKVISQTVFDDNRGFFSVPFRHDEFKVLGLPTNFVQDNHSRSIKGVVRGLHFQLWPPMGKIMRVTRGEAFLVTVDLRRDSPTFLDWIGVNASEDNRLQVWAPAEFARGFCALSDDTEVQYKCTGMFDPQGDSGIFWNDPAIGIDWPVKNPILSEKDRNAPTVAEWLKSH